MDGWHTARLQVRRPARSSTCEPARRRRCQCRRHLLRRQWEQTSNRRTPAPAPAPAPASVPVSVARAFSRSCEESTARFECACRTVCDGVDRANDANMQAAALSGTNGAGAATIITDCILDAEICAVERVSGVNSDGALKLMPFQDLAHAVPPPTSVRQLRQRHRR